MNKYISGATCGAGAALAWQNNLLWVAFPGGGGLGAAAPNYQLNIMPVQTDDPSDAWSFSRLLVLHEVSTEQPALVSFQGKLWLAWSGTDPAHRINLVALTIGQDNTLTPGTKITLDWTATGGPSLLAQGSSLYLAFSGGGGGGLGGAAPNGAINLASSNDGRNWPASQLTVFNQHHSLLSPSLSQSTDPGSAGPYIAFTGTNHLLYLVDARAPEPPVILQDVTDITRESDGDLEVDEYYETSDFAPSLGVFDDAGAPSPFFVWTGSGNNRHLYYMGTAGLDASEGVFFDATGAPLANGPVQHQAFADTSAFSPAVLGAGASRYVAWAGTDAAHRLNIGEFSQMQAISA